MLIQLFLYRPRLNNLLSRLDRTEECQGTELMAEAKKSKDIGMRRGRALASLSQQKQLDLIAEGLPLLMDSAADLLSASKALDQRHRAAHILMNHALEEAAKILILVDIVRCPSKIRPTRIGPMMGCFYDHLARLIYNEAQTWSVADVNQLQEYVDEHRKSHYLEGGMGEFIMPNISIYSRESLLYVDLVAHEDSDIYWSRPYHDWPVSEYSKMAAMDIGEALQKVGAFTREGLDIISSVWGRTEFVGDQHCSRIDPHTDEMLRELERAKLITESAEENHLRILYHRWQLPMYHINFKEEEVKLEDLRAQRDANFWAEIGYPETY